MSTSLNEIHEKAQQALETVAGDTGASPVLTAVVREFAAKASKAIELRDDDREWEAVIELEQAADSAKAAAEADPGAAEATTASVQDAHMAICVLKAGLRQNA